MRLPSVAVVGNDFMNWSIDRDREHAISFFEEAGARVVNSVSADVYYYVWYNQFFSRRRLGYRVCSAFPGKRVIAVVTNDIREQEADFDRLRRHVDLWVSPNSKVTRWLGERGAEVEEMMFYVSPGDFFAREESKEELGREIGVDAQLLRGRVVIGSLQRDSLAEDLDAPKWQKDPEMFARFCAELPQDEICALIGGPRRHYLVKRLRELEVPYVFIGDEGWIDRGEDDMEVHNLSSEVLNAAYNLMDVYVVSSKSEGGPKAVVEAGLVGTSVVSTDVGVSADVLPSEAMFDRENVVGEAVRLWPLVSDAGWRERVGTELRERFVREFSREVYTKRFVEMLERVS